MLPIVLDLRNQLCVVVGAGQVGQRKMQAILTAEARVRVVALERQPANWQSDSIEWLAEPYQCQHLDGARLVFAAAVPEVNARVAADAQRRGLLVNVASAPEQGNFTLPAVLRQGDLLVSVSTDGAGPSIARQLRDRIAGWLDPAYADWVRLLSEFRPRVLSMLPDPKVRSEFLKRISHESWLDRLRVEGIDAARAVLWNELHDLARNAGPSL